MSKGSWKKAERLLIPGPGDPSLKGELKRLAGSQSDDFNNLLINQTFNALWLGHSDKKVQTDQFIAVSMALAGIEPRDELEGMLAAQIMAVHAAAMECYRRAMLKDQTSEGRQANLGQAVKLSRVYAELLLALDKHRGKGQQRVTVEHVHVHQGGQAIVGAVRAGGGVPSKSEDLPHAKAVTDAAGEALPCQVEEVWDALPVARD
jgi:hypothetical protein